jgi:hypothetical protein
MSNFAAVYKNNRGELSIPLVESGGKFFLETETCKLEPFRATITDHLLGTLTHVKTVKAEEPVPLPSSPEHDAARAELDERLHKFPSEHITSFLSRQTALKKAIDRKDNFATASLAALTNWSTAIEVEIESLAAARKAAIPEPIPSKEELRRHFRGVRVGCLFVGNLAIPGSPENNWDAECNAECEGCHHKGNVKASTILKMQVRYLEPHQCGQPCR